MVKFNLAPVWKREVRVWGHSLQAITFDRLLYLHLHRLGLMGVKEKRCFERHVRSGMTVVDIGGNHGLHTLLLSKLVGGAGVVHAFEPEPELFAALETNCRLNGVHNVRVHNLALGAKGGTMVLSRSLLNAGDNRLTNAHEDSVTQKMSVKLAALDDVLGDVPVDFIKIDVQGWEMKVFEGMQKVFDRITQLKICFEFWPFGLREAGCDGLQLLEFLRARGFSFFEIGSDREIPIIKFEDYPGKIRGKGYSNLLAAR